MIFKLWSWIIETDLTNFIQKVTVNLPYFTDMVNSFTASVNYKRLKLSEMNIIFPQVSALMLSIPSIKLFVMNTCIAELLHALIYCIKVNIANHHFIYFDNIPKYIKLNEISW